MNDYAAQLTLDLNCERNIPKLYSAQFDKGRKIHLAVTADGEPFSAVGCDVVLKGEHIDHCHFAKSCTVLEDGTVEAELGEQLLSSRGMIVARFVLSDSSRSYSTQQFIVYVDSALEGNITTSEDYSVLNALLRQMYALDESGGILVEDHLDSASERPVQNRVIYEAVQPDATLSVSGKAADSKTVGDRLDKLTESEFHALPDSMKTEGVYWSRATSTAAASLKDNQWSLEYDSYLVPIEAVPSKFIISGSHKGNSTAMAQFVDKNYLRVEEGIHVGGTEVVTEENLAVTVTNPNIAYVLFTFLNTAEYSVSANNCDYAKAYKSVWDSQQDSQIAAQQAQISALQNALAKKPWSGKSVCCLGDSITYGDNGLHNGTGGNAISWVSHLGELCGFSTVYNRGYNGSCVADRETENSPSFCDRLESLPEADLYIIMGGVNDHWQSVPLGNITTDTTDTFYGAYKHVVEYLLTNYPTSQIMIMLSTKYNSATVPSGSSTNLGTYWQNRAGLYQTSYIAATNEVAARYCIPTLDLFTKSNICPFVDSQKNEYMGDGVHYLASGYERLAKGVIAPFINNNIAPYSD